MSERLKELKKTLEKAYQDEQGFARSLPTDLNTNPLTDEQVQTLDRHDLAIKATKKLIEAEERSISLELSKAEIAKTNEETLKTNGANMTTAEIEKKLMVSYMRSQKLDDSTLNKSELAVLRLARERSLELSRSQGTDVPAEGGFLTFETFSSQLIKSLKDFGGFAEAVDILTTSNGNTINFPTNDDTANMATPIGERIAAGTSNLTFGRRTWGSHKFTSGIFTVSNELLYDSIIDLEAFVMEAMRERFGRAINFYGTKGALANTSTPIGIATLGNGYTQTGLISNAVVSYDELVALTLRLDKAYRKKADTAWMLNDDTERVLRIMKDDNELPIWTMGDIRGGRPSTLLGYPIITNTDMDNLGSNDRVPISFGSHKTGYRHRQVGYVPFKKSTEYAFDSDEAAFVGFMRFDGKPRDTKAVVQLRTALGGL